LLLDRLTNNVTCNHRVTACQFIDKMHYKHNNCSSQFIRHIVLVKSIQRHLFSYQSWLSDSSLISFTIIYSHGHDTAVFHTTEIRLRGIWIWIIWCLVVFYHNSKVILLQTFELTWLIKLFLSRDFTCFCSWSFLAERNQVEVIAHIWKGFCSMFFSLTIIM